MFMLINNDDCLLRILDHTAFADACSFRLVSKQGNNVATGRTFHAISVTFERWQDESIRARMMRYARYARSLRLNLSESLYLWPASTTNTFI